MTAGPLEHELDRLAAHRCDCPICPRLAALAAVLQDDVDRKHRRVLELEVEAAHVAHLRREVEHLTRQLDAHRAAARRRRGEGAA